MKRRRRKKVGDYGPPLTFTERMDLGKELAHLRKSPAKRRGKHSAKPTAAEERSIYDAEKKAYEEKFLAESPCKQGRPSSGGCTRTGCCSWHKGIKPLTAPF